mmetsp:Transcript_103031/g.245407  ORF Transcript_103031/g.245407 Transcript_103031/m.245407 type:complete len:444 (-) Transcript_103031:153-1484(-)
MILGISYPSAMKMIRAPRLCSTGSGDFAAGPPGNREPAEEEASVQQGALPPEPMPCPALCAELVFLDEDTSDYDEERRSSAKGLVASLQRQLGDAGSHLRRKSAFGSLVSRGAFVRILGYEQQMRPVRQVPAASLDSERTAEWSRSGVVPERAGAKQAEGPPVPRLHDLPRPSRPLALPSDVLGAAVSALFSWLPSCTSVCAAQSETIRCAVPPMPFDAGEAKALEAGLGGWPLCLPEVFVAFLAPSSPAASSSSPGASPVAQAIAQADFQRAALELDERELVLLRPTVKSAASTPSTACTEKDAWPAPARLVCPRTGLSRVRSLRVGELTQVKAPTPHVLDFDCECSTGRFRLLLALPSADVAARFREASQVPMPAPASATRLCNAVRCELRINAQLQLSSARDIQNCSAVVKRGICEATHVSADRVLVQKIWTELSSFESG